MQSIHSSAVTAASTTTPAARSPATALATTPANSAPSTAFAGYQIIRRNGAVVAFEPSKIAVALTKAFLAVHGTQGAASASVRETVEQLTESVVHLRSSGTSSEVICSDKR